MDPQNSENENTQQGGNEEFVDEVLDPLLKGIDMSALDGLIMTLTPREDDMEPARVLTPQPNVNDLICNEVLDAILDVIDPSQYPTAAEDPQPQAGGSPPITSYQAYFPSYQYVPYGPVPPNGLPPCLVEVPSNSSVENVTHAFCGMVSLPMYRPIQALVERPKPLVREAFCCEKAREWNERKRNGCIRVRGRPGRVPHSPDCPNREKNKGRTRKPKGSKK